MNAARHIMAEHVLLALVARRANPSCVWAAMADHHWTPRDCRLRYSGPTTVYARPPALTPMQRGGLHRAIQRQRLTEGLASIRKTFGAGLRAVLAEPAHVVPAVSRDAPAGAQAAKGMSWWNSLSEPDRLAWSRKAGSTGVVADVWACAVANEFAL